MHSGRKNTGVDNGKARVRWLLHEPGMSDESYLYVREGKGAES